MSFNKVVKVTQSYKNCQQIAYVELATLDPQSHLNIYVSDSTAKGAGISRLCMAPQDAMALRDALMEAYPVRTYPVGPRFVVDPTPANPFAMGDTGTYIVALNENGGPKPSANPHVHTSRTAAETEAERLASKHGGDFVVYRAVTMKRRPKVVVPPVSSIKLD